VSGVGCEVLLLLVSWFVNKTPGEQKAAPKKIK
jgi:hypothetical protein